MDMTAQGGAPAAPEMGPLARLIGVFTSPSRTFASIAAKPGWDWLVPLVILIGLSVVGSVLVAPKLDVEGAVAKTMERLEKRNTQMTDAQRTQIESTVRKQFGFFTSGPGRAIGGVFIVVAVFFVPAVYHGVAAAFGLKKSYMGVVAGYTYVQIVQAVKGILLLAVASAKTSIDIEGINHLVKSNLGAFLDPETTGKVVMVLATNIDVFEIWAIVLGSIALSKTTQFSPKGAAVTVVSVWVLYLLLQTAGAALGAAFGG